ncbi:MAG: ATPase, T2SS/T4P/T4SS family [Candidatus Omnitrophica bacterium]|nr:ATPase, T2SS/T4P/T4SS family [Candidatus Omnitrophota bacterium]
MTRNLKERVIQTLQDSLNIKAEDIESALHLQKTQKVSFSKSLIKKGLISEEDLLVLLVKELRIPFIHLKKYKIDPILKEVIPEVIARQYHILPLSKLEDTITVVISDPLNILTMDDLQNVTGHHVEVVMSTETEILEGIDHYYGSKLSTSIQDITKDISLDDFEIVAEQEGGPEELKIDAGEQAPVIRMVNLIIKEALSQRASDIHIEPFPENMRVRYRIDGVLHDVLTIPKENQNAVTVRTKIMSRLDITANRIPQDGRFKMLIGNKEIDFRVSLLPTSYGQKIVMRVLDKQNLKIGLEGLGFNAHSVELLNKASHQPFGMVLVTGPTGSGKSTTLYSIINALNTVEKNIITVEDPVEYLVEGLTQIQARPEVGLTFASGLRAMLRQSPDIVMVGEIRDSETADIAIKASLTGQLVFSTLHTNDSAGALTRLVDMGVESFLVASSLILVCAQRLCRKVCPQCKVPVEIPKDVLKNLKIKVDSKSVIYQGKGCAHCRQSGYRGRMGITEILEIDDTVREMLIAKKSSDEIKRYAQEKQGMKSLWDDAVEKLLRGETTLDEVLRISSSD